jgi:hypothetical protein
LVSAVNQPSGANAPTRAPVAGGSYEKLTDTGMRRSKVVDVDGFYWKVRSP